MTDDAILFRVPALAGRETRKLPDRGVIFLKGARGDYAYLVVAGRVEVRDGGQALESIGPGGLFGEMAMLDDEPRSASAVAVGPVELLPIAPDDFRRLVAGDVDFALGVMRLMARRLRVTTRARAPDPRLKQLPAVG